jgi:hypothetical protein
LHRASPVGRAALTILAGHLRFGKDGLADLQSRATRAQLSKQWEKTEQQLDEFGFFLPFANNVITYKH